MNTPPTDGRRPLPDDRAPVGPGEDTLRLIATLPAPDGLADRVRERVHAAPQAARIFIWRGPLRPPGGWMFSGLARGLAAAAIVCVVAGGGWRICSRVQPADKVEGMHDPFFPRSNGFSPTNLRHVPETLQGPVLNHPVAPPSAVDVVEQPPAGAKPAAPHSKKKKAPPAPAVNPQ